MSRVLALPFLLTLAACATPQQQCIADATAELRTVNGLVAQLQADLARGYGMADKQVVNSVWRPCFHHHYGGWDGRGPGPDGHPHGPPPPEFDMCLRDEIQTVQVPVPVDLVEERRQLDQLLKRQAVLNRAAAPAIAQCQAQYPE